VFNGVCGGGDRRLGSIQTGAEFVWLLSGTLNAMMAIPNLIALAALSPIVFKLTQEFFDTRGKSEKNPF
jgi:AGCS family alanine or glycine:cation symporter